MKAILTYHSIDDSGSVISVDVERFRIQMEWLARSDIEVVSLEALLSAPSDVDAVALTFDDGFQNFYTSAWPILRANSLCATVFLVTDCIGTTNSWSGNGTVNVPDLPLMSWTEVEELASAGVAFGSHTRTHRDLRLVSEEQIAGEVLSAAELIRDRLGMPVRTFAYPYGGVDPRAVTAVARAHSIACTTELRPLVADEDSLRLPRLDAFYFRRPRILEGYGSPTFRRYIWLRASGRRLRQALMQERRA